VSLKRYLPSLPTVTQQTVIFIVASLAAAWVLGKVPALRRLTRDD
jgi:hypothetical protein